MLKSLLYAGFLLLIWAFGCTSSCNKSANNDTSQSKDGSAAIVNGKMLDSHKLEELHKRAVEKLSKTGRVVSEDLSRKMRGSILRKMIDDEIIAQRAETMGIKVDRFDRVKALEQYKGRIGGPEAFEMFLSQQDLTEEQVVDNILNEAVRSKIVEKTAGKIDVSNEEIKSHYESNAKLYSLPEMIHARHILLKVSPTDPQEKIDLVIKKAQGILDEAKDPRVAFSALVQKYSEGPSAAQGGDLGFFPRGRMVKEFEDAAFNAPLKQAVGPIKTEYGYHIIYVEEKSAARTAPLDEVRPRIVEFITRNKQARKTEDMLFSLRKSANIKINDPSLTEEEFRDLSKEEQVASKEGNH